MKAVHLLAAAALAACATRPGSYDDVYRAQGAATLGSLPCSQRTVLDLGYRVTWYDGGSARGSLRAERPINEGAEGSRGILTVSVPVDPGDVMFVTAERIVDGTRQPVPAHPGPRPTPTPTPIPATGRMRPQRLSPGPVASDARNVLRRCGTAGIDVE